MKRFIFAFVLAISFFGLTGCPREPVIEPETNTWTYPVAQEDVIKMWVNNSGNGVYLYVWTADENGDLFAEEDYIGGYRLFIAGTNFMVVPMYYTSNSSPIDCYYPITSSWLPCSDYEQFIDEVQNHPATLAGYNLYIDVPGHEEEVEQLWDLFHKLDDFYMAHSGNPAPPLMAE